MLTRRRVSLLAAIVFSSAILALSGCAGGGKRPAEGGQPRPDPMHIRRPRPIVQRRRVSTAARPPTWAKPAGRASLQTGPQSEPWPAGPSPPRRTPRASCPCQEPLTASAFAAQR